MSRYMMQIKDIYLMFSGNGLMMTIWIVVMGVALSTKGNKQLKQFFVYPSIFILILGFNPFTIIGIIQSGFVVEERFVRIFWTLQIGFMIAYAFTYVCSRCKSRRNIIFMTFFCLIIVLSGKYMFTKDNFQIPTNYYKLPVGTIEVADCIEKDCTERGATLQKMKVTVPTSLSPYIRQYNGNINMTYGRNAEGPLMLEIQNLMQEPILNIANIAKCTREMGCDYVVLEEKKVKTGAMEENNFVLVKNVSGYEVFRNSARMQ